MGSMIRRKKQSNNESTLYSSLETDENVGDKKGMTKKRRRKRRKDVEPFLITNLKVGSVIAVVGILFYILYTITISVKAKIWGYDSRQPDNAWSQYMADEAGGAADVQKSRIFPSFDINDDKINAFSVAQPKVPNDHDSTEGKEKDPKKEALSEVLHLVRELKGEFVSMYGGENAAREILNRGIISFPSSKSLENGDAMEGIRNIARRILHAKNEKKTFKLSFAGSSAVAGYGNYLKQTFPSIIADILTAPMEPLGIELEVRNAAIMDISSFPYGWCLNSFMGEEADVVSWDSSFMNRADTNAAFEAYLRRVVAMESAPMLIVREGAYSEARRQILQKYVDSGALIDPIIINIDAAAEPFLDVHEDVLPPGLQEWFEFGAPNGAPGKVRSGRATRLSVKQHQLVGWLIVMHFITAIELSATHIMGFDDSTSIDWLKKELNTKTVTLPKPQAKYAELESTLMFGRPKDENLGINSTEWEMDEIHCMTTFEPITTGGQLDELIISGSSSNDIDLLLPRGPLLYNKNWVMDLGIEAKQNANNFKRYNFDYRFTKKAYYGIKPSGSLTMFVPLREKEGGGGLFGLKSIHRTKDPSEVFGNLILCEVNDYIGEKQCNMENSMEYIVGGTNAKASYIKANGVSYQGKKICISLNVPTSAKWTTRKKLEKEMQDKGLRQKSRRKDEHGISLKISVKDELLFWKDGPCSISHILWEQKKI